MRRFSFSLDRVLDFKRQMEEQEFGRLQALHFERLRLEQQACQLHQESRSVRTACVVQAVVASPELRHVYEYVDALKRARVETLARVGEVEERRRQQILTVIEARRQVKLLELLKAGKLLRHRAQARREEQILADELHVANLQRGEKKPSTPLRRTR